MDRTSRRRREIVVITGGSAGVGRAAAREFASHGADVALLARDEERLSAAKREVEQLGGRSVAISTDVADADQVETAADRIERELGPIDVWVNNAMTTVFSPLKDVTPEEFRRATEVTYLGTVYGTMAALKRMWPRNRGTIVQVGSALSYRGIPLQAAYCGAKHAIRGFTDSLRCELLHEQKHIHLTMVQLPALNTPQFNWCRTKLPKHPQPVPPIFQPEVAARAVVWAAHHRRREVFVGGPTVTTIWGNKVLPWAGDWYLSWNGYQSQQMDEAIENGRPDNLFHPVPGDYAAHGIFDQRSTDTSWQFQLTKQRNVMAAAAAMVLGTIGGYFMAR